MTRLPRMFDIIQLLRQAKRPLRAEDMAQTLEVTIRTIYRDIASLQAMRVPIEGAAGIGYIMRPGFDLPPLNFDVEEAEAITVGLNMIARTGDTSLHKAARSAARKIMDATPLSNSLFTSTWGPEAPTGVDLSEIREATRQEQKIRIEYLDAEDEPSTRIIKPLAVVYYAESIVLAAYCELRQGFRHFRVDRMERYAVLQNSFKGEGKALLEEWRLEHGHAFELKD